MQKKTFNKIQHSFIIKTLNKVGIKGNQLNITKTKYGKKKSQLTYKIVKDQKLFL